MKSQTHKQPNDGENEAVATCREIDASFGKETHIHVLYRNIGFICRLNCFTKTKLQSQDSLLQKPKLVELIFRCISMA